MTKITRKWGRFQNHVDYRPFEGNVLVLRPEAVIPVGIDERGMGVMMTDR